MGNETAAWIFLTEYPNGECLSLSRFFQSLHVSTGREMGATIEIELS